MKVKIVRPLADRVLLVRAEDDDSAGYLETPDKVKEKPVQGRVLRVGPGKIVESGATIPVAVKPGDTVIFGRYGGTDIDLGPGCEYSLFREDEIMGVIEEVDESEIEGGIGGEVDTPNR